MNDDAGAGVKHLTTEELAAGLDEIRRAPRDGGVLRAIVRRPKVGQREELLEGRLDLAEGLAGDNWRVRGSSKTEDGSAHPEMQLNVMNARVAALVAQGRERWKLAGDQLYVDMDLSVENLPPGTRLRVGAAVIEITGVPHLGCKKFTSRFGLAATKFVNTDEGKALRMRGVNARVVEPGAIRVGDAVRKG
jgi:hypothetical protein